MLTMDDFCRDSQCNEMYTAMAVFVYNHSAARIQTPFGNYSTFGDCLVDDYGNLVTSNVGACQSCSFINTFDNNGAPQLQGSVQAALDMGVLPILNYIPTGQNDLNVRGGATGIYVTNYDNAKTTKENCPECILLTNNPSSLVTGGFAPIFPTMLYNFSQTIVANNPPQGQDIITYTFNALNNSALANMARAWKIPAILRLDVNSLIFSNPQYWLNFSISKRADLVNSGIGGIVITGDTNSLISNFCPYEKAFRTLTGRDVSYVLGRKPVVNETLFQSERPFEVKNKRSLSSIPSSLCVNSSWFGINQYSIVCYSKSTEDLSIVVSSFSPTNLSIILSDQILYDMYAPIIGSVGRNSGIYACKYITNGTTQIPTYTYDLVPSTDFTGEAPMLVPNETGLACFKEPIRQIDILRLTGQSLENLNCYARSGCCRDTSEMPGNPAKYICENEFNPAGWYNTTSGLCYYQRLNHNCLNQNFNNDLNCWSNYKVNNCNPQSNDPSCWNVADQPQSFSFDIYALRNNNGESISPETVNYNAWITGYRSLQYNIQAQIQGNVTNFFNTIVRGSYAPSILIGPTWDADNSANNVCSWGGVIGRSYNSEQEVVNDGNNRMDQLVSSIGAAFRSLGYYYVFEVNHSYDGPSIYNQPGDDCSPWSGFYRNVYMKAIWCSNQYEHTNISYNSSASPKQRVLDGLCFKGYNASKACQGYDMMININGINYCVQGRKTALDFCNNDLNGLWVVDDPNNPNWAGRCYNKNMYYTSEQLLCDVNTPQYTRPSSCPPVTIQPPIGTGNNRPNIDILLGGYTGAGGETGGTGGGTGGGGEAGNREPDIIIYVS
jgi:hypothetical protein